MSQAKANHSSLDDWIARLGERDMPVFADTARRISALSVQDDASLTDLVQTIMRDGLMTTRVLKVANSVFYQPGRGNISTVSRAVVVMGFETVRALALSVSLVEALGEGAQRERVAREVARAFHAALHAKTFAAHQGCENPEEVYTATLLYRIGEIAFWCFGGEEAKRLEAALAKPRVTPEQAERAVLGFRLEELSSRVGDEWRLGEMLHAAHHPEGEPSAAVRSMTLAHRLAGAVEQGWNSPELAPVLEEVTDFLGMPPATVLDMVHGNAQSAAENAGFMGASKAGGLIPRPPERDELHARIKLKERETAEPEGLTLVDESVRLRPDRGLQLNILWDLSAMLEGNPDPNLFLPTVLEGITRGIGMDRVLLAFHNGNRRTFKVKFAIGGFERHAAQGYEFSSTPHPPNLFGYMVEARQAVWARLDPAWEMRNLLAGEVLKISDHAPFFLAPIKVDRRTVGLIYADCQPSNRELTEEGFLAFQHFARQASFAFSLMSLRSK